MGSAGVSMTEEAVLFGAEKRLVGILTRPGEDVSGANRPAVVILNAGLVHRVGPNRLGVKLARDLANHSYLALRFDLSGIGDSPSRQDGMPFHQSALAETVEAMDRLSAMAGVQRFILTGICTGASVALGTALRDSRVAGAILINLRAADLGSEDLVSQRALHLSEARRIFGFHLPLDLIARRVGVGKSVRVVLDLLRDIPGRGRVAAQARLIQAKLRIPADRGVPLLMVCSRWDSAFRYRRLLFGEATAGGGEGITAETIEDADHTFSTLASQALLLGAIRRWLAQRRW
jgi:pimeloyl-ACP methyl ester carboxylesterase